MESITLINKSAAHGKFIGELPHGIICRRTGVCRCAKRQTVGTSGKRKTVRTPATFTVFVGGTTVVPALAAGLPAVREAIKRGWLATSGSPESADTEKALRLVRRSASSPKEAQLPNAHTIAYAKATPPTVKPAVQNAVDAGTQAMNTPTKTRRGK